MMNFFGKPFRKPRVRNYFPEINEIVESYMTDKLSEIIVIESFDSAGFERNHPEGINDCVYDGYKSMW